MTLQITYNDLMLLERDIYEQMKSPAFKIFNQDKIKRFFQLNSMRLNAMHETMNALIKKHVLHDEKDKPVTFEENGAMRYKFKNNDDETIYKEEAEKFLSRTIKLDL